MKRTVLTLAILALLPLSAVAQTITTKPDGGRLLGFAGSDVPGKWAVFAAGFLPVQPTVLDGGKCITWQGPAGDYGIVFFPPDGEAITAKVTLGGENPQPPPFNPLSPLATQIRDWASTLVPTNALVKRDAVAQSLDSVRAQMAAGTLTEPAKIVAATRDANQAAVGELRESWLPFFEKLRDYLNAESQAGRLATVEQHIAVWKGISEGLRAVK